MEKYSIQEVIEQAVQTERLGQQYYNDMAEKYMENEELKKLFNMLAAKEVEHEHKFAGLKTRVQGAEPEGWDEASGYLRAIVESAFFLGKDKALSDMKNIISPLGAVTYAIGFEKESLLYYLEMKRSVGEKDLLEEIINEERDHIISLIGIKQKLMNK